MTYLPNPIYHLRRKGHFELFQSRLVGVITIICPDNLFGQVEHSPYLANALWNLG